MASIRSRFELRGRSYIVTGGAMGIGFAISKDICEMGGNVAVIDLRETPLEPVMELAEQYGVKTHYFQADVSNEQSLQSAFDRAISALGKLDGIVTAAGIAIDKPFVSQGWEEVNKVIQVNVGMVRNRVRCKAKPIRRVSGRSSQRRWPSSRCKSRARLGAWS